LNRPLSAKSATVLGLVKDAARRCAVAASGHP